MKDPCRQECRDRKAGCAVGCLKRQAWTELREREQKNRRRAMMLDDYISRAVNRNRKRKGQK